MSLSNDGKWAENQVHKYLDKWNNADPYREYARLVDTKAAGRIIKAAAADFEYFASGPNSIVICAVHGLIEVKETAHEYRLDRSRVSQLPRIRKREKCGGTSYVLVYHTTLKQWRVLDVPFLMADNDKGSWDLRSQPTFKDCALALHSVGTFRGAW